MRVLFLYSNRVRDLLPAPPIGLSYVASATADAGHEVSFLDLLLSRRDLRELRRALQHFAPQVVAISVRNIDNVVRQRLRTHLDELDREIALIRELSGATIVIGGPAVSILGCGALRQIDADIAILGEGEETFPKLLAALEHGGDGSGIPGVCLRAKGRSMQAEPQRVARLGPSGMERWVDWRRYEPWGATWPLQTRRGCPLHCTYCSYPSIEGRPMRRREPEEVVAEMRRVVRSANPRCFEFVDSVFNVPEGYAVALCEAIIRSGLKVRLTTMGVNPRGVSRELFQAMRRAGFRSMMVTPESASDVILARMRKGFTREDVIRCAELVRDSDIPSMWFFLLGAPGETQETAEETVSFAEQYLNRADCLPMFTTGIRMLHGTELVTQARHEGYLAAGQGLDQAVFYLSPQVPEAWLLDRVDRAVEACPTVVHAAEDPAGRPMARVLFRALHLLGVAPPYWRFIPRLLSSTLVHRARVRQKRRARRSGDPL